MKALMLALQNPGVPGVLAGRVYPDVRDTLEPEIYGLNDAIHKATGVNLIVRHSKSDGVLHMLNGAQIWLRSYDKPQRLLGRNLGWACLDELEFSVAPVDELMRLKIHVPFVYLPSWRLPVTYTPVICGASPPALVRM